MPDLPPWRGLHCEYVCAKTDEILHAIVTKNMERGDIISSDEGEGATLDGMMSQGFCMIWTVNIIPTERDERRG